MLLSSKIDAKIKPVEEIMVAVVVPNNNNCCPSQQMGAIPPPPLPSTQSPSSPNSSTKMPAAFLLYPLLYFGLWLLFSIQLVAILKNHSHLGGLTMFDTILLIIVKANPKVPPFSWVFYQSAPKKVDAIAAELPPLLMVIGGIVFQALLFVNFTHALEAISCADSSSHFSFQFIVMVSINFVAKLPLLFCSSLLPDISCPNRLLLHFGPSLATLALFAANWHFSPGDDFLISHLDRYFGATMCLLLAIAIFPICRKNLPYLLCDVPTGVNKDELMVEIEQKFNQIRCQHMHIYRKWPGTNRFDVFAHVQINLGDLGEKEAEKEIGQILMDLHKMLTGKGARKVSIQPRVVAAKNELEVEKKWPQQQFCIDEDCQRKERTCCNATPIGGVEENGRKTKD